MTPTLRSSLSATLVFLSASACALLPGSDATPVPPAEATPHWIWVDDEERDGSEGWFWYAFEWNDTVESAELFATCDNRMQFYLNGESVVSSDEWESPVKLDVASMVRTGRNVIGAWGQNGNGPAGLVASLTLKGANGTGVVATSDAWRVTEERPGGDWMTLASNAQASGWTHPVDLGAYGVKPWGDLGEGTAPPEEFALAASEIELPEGFAAELLYSVPRAQQGSWVSLCADDRGRLYTSDQYGGLFRVTPGAPGSPEDTKVEPLDIALGEAHGLLWAFDSLYVVVNRGGKHDSGLYRLRDTTGDDQFDELRLLRLFDGNGEHGPHAVLPSPDGESLYVVAGNHTNLPDFITSSRVPRVWDEDQLLPRLPDPNGHAVGKMAPAGWIVRTDPEGKEWELVAMGFRNAYDIDFDPSGELFTFDSDMEWDTGLPWYRPTRVLHVQSGAEFGWRNGSGKWPTFYPDSLPTTVDIGLSSPTGVVFGTNASFPMRWRRAFYASDWAYGTIHAVHIEPNGAGFTGTSEPFVQGKPLPVTDVAIAPDGAFYFTTGGRRAQSGLYRVRWTGELTAADRAPIEVQPTTAALSRRALEAFHRNGADGPAVIEAAWSSLGSPDRALRFAARTALEHLPADAWRDRALAETAWPARREALLGLIRTDATLEQGTVIDAALAWPWREMSLEELGPSLRVASLGMIRVGDDDARWSELIAPIEERLPTGDDVLDRELCRVLVKLGSETATAKALGLLVNAPTQESAVDLALILSNATVGWDDASRARYLRWFDVDSTELAGGNSFKKYIDEARKDALESLGISMPIVASAPRATSPTGTTAPFVQDWTLDDLEPELGRVATGRSFENGQKVFARTSCIDCHRIGGEGGSTGPDLTGAGSRFGPRDLLETIVDPSATISDQYVDTEIWTLDGKVEVGRLVDASTESLTLRRATDETDVTIAREDIELERPHPLSRMPEGLLDTCELDDILDLLAYVIAGADPNAAAFASEAGSK